MMTNQESRIPCGCGCDTPEPTKHADRWYAIAGLLLVLAGALIFGTGCTKDEPVKAAVIQEDRICRAKFNDFMLHPESLPKAELERWVAFRLHMGDCLR